MPECPSRASIFNSRQCLVYVLSLSKRTEVENGPDGDMTTGNEPSKTWGSSSERAYPTNGLLKTKFYTYDASSTNAEEIDPDPGLVETIRSIIPELMDYLLPDCDGPGIKCPVCSKFVLPDDIECHLVMCLTKPRLIYNEDVLTEDKGECVICLEELTQGNTIARLPCLCIYHKSCIDRWFDVNRSCPEHPGD